MFLGRGGAHVILRGHHPDARSKNMIAPIPSMPRSRTVQAAYAPAVRLFIYSR